MMVSWRVCVCTDCLDITSESLLLKLSLMLRSMVLQETNLSCFEEGAFGWSVWFSLNLKVSFYDVISTLCGTRWMESLSRLSMDCVGNCCSRDFGKLCRVLLNLLLKFCMFLASELSTSAKSRRDPDDCLESLWFGLLVLLKLKNCLSLRYFWFIVFGDVLNSCDPFFFRWKLLNLYWVWCGASTYALSAMLN